jgi:uncharacterized membrane protein HdeD (DUF308 family)
MTNQSINSSVSMAGVASEHRGWFVFLGIALIVIGMVAIAFPFVATIAAKTVIGWLFLIGGVIQVVHAFSTQKWSAFLFELIVGVLYVLAGGWMAFFPFAGIITLTIFLAVFFVIEGVIEIAMGFRVRPAAGWVWLLVSGIIAIAAGLLILAGLPSTAVWAIGLLVGINLIFSGISYLTLATAAKP